MNSSPQKPATFLGFNAVLPEGPKDTVLVFGLVNTVRANISPDSMNLLMILTRHDKLPKFL